MSKSGIVIPIAIHRISVPLKSSQKYNILMQVTRIGQNVLYRGKNTTESIFSKLFIQVTSEI